MRRSGFTARTHSVYHGALNLTAGKELLTVAVPDVGALPNGILLDQGDDFLARGLAPGMLLRSNGTQLRCVDLPFGIDLETATVWSPVLPAVATVRPLQSTAAVLSPLLRDVPARGGFGPLLARLVGSESPPVQPLPVPSASAQPAITHLLEALRTDRLAQAVEAANALIGLGDGLTPSGDDFLVGLSAGLSAIEHHLARPFASACYARARGRTTRVAEMFLESAADGAYAARVHGLIGALRADIPDRDLAQAMVSTLSWGGTSGGDCLLGVLYGSTLSDSAEFAAVDGNFRTL